MQGLGDLCDPGAGGSSRAIYCRLLAVLCHRASKACTTQHHASGSQHSLSNQRGPFSTASSSHAASLTPQCTAGISGGFLAAHPSFSLMAMASPASSPPPEKLLWSLSSSEHSLALHPGRIRMRTSVSCSPCGRWIILVDYFRTALLRGPTGDASCKQSAQVAVVQASRGRIVDCRQHEYQGETVECSWTQSGKRLPPSSVCNDIGILSRCKRNTNVSCTSTCFVHHLEIPLQAAMAMTWSES